MLKKSWYIHKGKEKKNIRQQKAACTTRGYRKNWKQVSTGEGQDAVWWQI